MKVTLKTFKVLRGVIQTMDSTTLTKQVKLQQWSEIFQMRKSSGLTIAEFCKENSIQPSKYYYWLKHVRQAACDQLPAPLSKPVNPIVPVTFKEPMASLESNVCSPYAMRITMSGVSVEFTNDATPQLIESALQVLSHAR